MNKDVAKAQAETAEGWADQWSRDQSEGSSEVAFLLRRAAKLMRGDTDTEIELSPAPVVSELSGD